MLKLETDLRPGKRRRRKRQCTGTRNSRLSIPSVLGMKFNESNWISGTSSRRGSTCNNPQPHHLRRCCIMSVAVAVVVAVAVPSSSGHCILTFTSLG